MVLLLLSQSNCLLFHFLTNCLARTSMTIPACLSSTPVSVPLVAVSPQQGAQSGKELWLVRGASLLQPPGVCHGPHTHLLLCGAKLLSFGHCPQLPGVSPFLGFCFSAPSHTSGGQLGVSSHLPIFWGLWCSSFLCVVNVGPRSLVL